MDGVIRRIIEQKGFGFIGVADSKTEYFFHRSGVSAPTRFEQLMEGDAVTFELDHNATKGPRATDVREV